MPVVVLRVRVAPSGAALPPMVPRVKSLPVSVVCALTSTRAASRSEVTEPETRSRLMVMLPVAAPVTVRVSAASVPVRAISRVRVPEPEMLVTERESVAVVLSRETVPALARLPVMAEVPLAWRVALAAVVKVPVPSCRLAVDRWMVPALWAKEAKRLLAASVWAPVMVQVPTPDLVTALKPERLAREKVPVVLASPVRLRLARLVSSVPVPSVSLPMRAPVMVVVP